MDLKDFDYRLKQLLSGIPTEGDIDKLLADLDNVTENYEQAAADIAVEEHGGSYKAGYDTGFVDGYQEGKSIAEHDNESIGYNQAVDDIVNTINKIDFELKDEFIELINQLRK